MYSGLGQYLTECECCGDRGFHHGCTLLPDRIVCKDCLMVWYDGGMTKPDEIGQKCKQLRSDTKSWLNRGKEMKI